MKNLFARYRPPEAPIEPDTIHLEADVPRELYDKLHVQLMKSGGTFEEWLRLQLRGAAQRQMVFGLNDELTFGRYRGEKLKIVIHNDPGYLMWVLTNTSYSLDDEAEAVLSKILGDADNDDDMRFD